jgi:hypothetical protein
MRLQRLLASVPALLLAPAAAQAQTEEIQQEVETKLWIQFVLTKIQDATGAPPLVSILTLVALVVALVASVWLLLAWRKRARE